MSEILQQPAADEPVVTPQPSAPELSSPEPSPAPALPAAPPVAPTPVGQTYQLAIDPAVLTQQLILLQELQQHYESNQTVSHVLRGIVTLLREIAMIAFFEHDMSTEALDPLQLLEGYVTNQAVPHVVLGRLVQTALLEDSKVINRAGRPEQLAMLIQRYGLHEARARIQAAVQAATPHRTPRPKNE